MSAAGLAWARSLTWDRTGREMRDIFLAEIESARSENRG